MQIKDREDRNQLDWSHLDEPKLHRMTQGFKSGVGFEPTEIDDDETLTAPIDLDFEDLDERDRVKDDSPPSR